MNEKLAQPMLGQISDWNARQSPRQSALLALAVLALFHLTFSYAATLTWDANGSAAPNPSDGSGNWATAGNWWDGAGNVSGTWSGAYR